MAPYAAAASCWQGFPCGRYGKKKSDHRCRPMKLAARAAAAIVSLAGSLTLMEHAQARFQNRSIMCSFGLDRVCRLPPSASSCPQSPPELFFCLVSHCWESTGGRSIDIWVAQFFCLPACIAPVFALLGLLWGPSALSPITVPDTDGDRIFGAGGRATVFAQKLGNGRLPTHRSPGTTFLRRALPSGMLVLGIIGWLISKPLLTEVHFTWVEVSALAIVTGALLVSFIVWTAIVVDRSDGQRRKTGGGAATRPSANGSAAGAG